MAQEYQAVDLNYKPGALAGSVDNIEDKISWSTDKYNKLMESIDSGYKPKSTPFYEGNPILKKGNLVFDYTDEEIKELTRCSTDIVYFANNYCTVMTDNGLQTIHLRDYQEDMVNTYLNNRNSVCLAARQVGKCQSVDSLVYINNKKVSIGQFYYTELAKIRPLTLIERIKLILYKLI